MDDSEDRPGRSSFVDSLTNVASADVAGEAAGCLLEAAFTGCAPAMPLLVGAPALLMWWT